MFYKIQQQIPELCNNISTIFYKLRELRTIYQNNPRYIAHLAILQKNYDLRLRSFVLFLLQNTNFVYNNLGMDRYKRAFDINVFNKLIWKTIKQHNNNIQ
jgi:hypothetical protein